MAGTGWLIGFGMKRNQGYVKKPPTGIDARQSSLHLNWSAHLVTSFAHPFRAVPKRD
jgi:hypothetical protein